MACIDHLVVMASNLAQGVAWCEATLGVTPGRGGEHPLMGTHNRLLKIATAEHRTAYLEIIAINPIAIPSINTGARRWFDMDYPALQAHVAQHGPQLTHFVAGVPDITAAVAALAAQGLDRGAIVQASRTTPSGLLQWQISVRADGQRLFDGCLPTLIQWGTTHPTDAMSDSGVALLGLQVQHPQAATLASAYNTLGLSDRVTPAPGPARLSARLQTPKGLVEIHTP
ncbi:VOC family protein [Rhodoferax sp. AJA081-3]|uniref:VOC family protein n=1 Tax=Rhodoferax sp. AJA081-3 TaxID=2752316 RepID=UPI001ADFBA24|nr:VOC family protein [Rhodoferax sp. AJA081-3]QTN30299.1 VOC family protein [Rhodoferax sp. AJA081-3]